MCVGIFIYLYDLQKNMFKLECFYNPKDFFTDLIYS